MSGQDVLSLLKANAEGDEAFLSVALQIASREARAGNRAFAAEMKDLVQRARNRRNAEPRAAPVLRADGWSEAGRPRGGLGDIALAPEARTRLERFLRGQEGRARLRNSGGAPPSRILLSGPGGTGKRTVAAALAGELRLPLIERELTSRANFRDVTIELDEASPLLIAGGAAAIRGGDRVALEAVPGPAMFAARRAFRSSFSHIL